MMLIRDLVRNIDVPLSYLKAEHTCDVILCMGEYMYIYIYIYIYIILHILIYFILYFVVILYYFINLFVLIMVSVVQVLTIKNNHCG